MKRIILFLMLVMVLAVCLCAMMGTIGFAADGATESDVVAVDTDVGGMEAAVPRISFDSTAAIGTFLAMVILATIIETIAEWIKAGIAPAVLKKWAWLLITSAMGILLCLLFRVDFFAAVGFTGGILAAYVGQIITGIAVGAGSSAVHILLNKTSANTLKPIAGVTMIQNGGISVENSESPPDSKTSP